MAVMALMPGPTNVNPGVSATASQKVAFSLRNYLVNDEYVIMNGDYVVVRSYHTGLKMDRRVHTFSNFDAANPKL